VTETVRRKVARKKAGNRRFVLAVYLNGLDPFALLERSAGVSREKPGVIR
jgi:hypothetical protein